MGLGGMVLLHHLPAQQKGPPSAAMKILPIFVADEAAGGAAAADGGGGGGAAAAAAANYQLHCLAYHSANLLTPSTQVKIFSIPNQYSSKIPPHKRKNQKSKISNSYIKIHAAFLLFL